VPDDPILRARDVTGEVYDDPSEDGLYMLLQDLRSPDQFVRVERLEEERQGEWAQGDDHAARPVRVHQQSERA
jgi:hypothetical protein